MESTLGEDAMKIVEMTTKDSEYYINLADKAVAEFKTIDCNFERRFTVGKILSSSITCYREMIDERKSQSVWQNSFFLILRNCHSSPKPSAATTLISQLPSVLRQDPPPAKRL